MKEMEHTGRELKEKKNIEERGKERKEYEKKK